MQFYSSFFLILCKRLQLSGGAELNLFSDLRLQSKLGVQGLGRYLMSIGNNLKLPHFELIRCSAKGSGVIYPSHGFVVGFGGCSRQETPFLLRFHFSPLGSSASHLPGFLHFSPGEGHRPRILAQENYPGLFSHFLSLTPVLKWQRITRIPTDGGVNTTEIGKKGPEARRKGVIGFFGVPICFL